MNIYTHMNIHVCVCVYVHSLLHEDYTGYNIGFVAHTKKMKGLTWPCFKACCHLQRFILKVRPKHSTLNLVNPKRYSLQILNKKPETLCPTCQSHLHSPGPSLKQPCFAQTDMEALKGQDTDCSLSKKEAE